MFFTSFAGVLLALIISKTTNGQRYVNYPGSSKFLPSVEKSDPAITSSRTYLTNVNWKAARTFVRAYKNVQNEQWYDLPDGLIAKFALNDIKYRVYFDKKGNWHHAIRTYDETKLSPEVRHVVKRSYYDYNIALIQEIEMPFKVFTYIILLEGRTNWINLRISEGEIDEYQKFDK